MKAFVITWLLFLVLLSLILTGAFYLAHASEFPTTTITNSTSWTSTVLTFSNTTTITGSNGEFTFTSGQSLTNYCPISQTCLKTSTSESRTVSDYGTLGLLLTVILIAVLVVIAVVRRHYKK